MRRFSRGLGLACLPILAAPAFGEPIVVRVGHFPNLTHAQAVVAQGLSRQGHGWFEARLGPGVRVEWFVYDSGPSAMEALFARSLDLTYVGPTPTTNAHLRSGGSEIRILCGACSGGSALVVHAEGGIGSDADFRGKRLVTPQIGNTQDVAARAWLQRRGYKVTMTGGDVLVVPATPADQLALFEQRRADAVWTVEPWVSRLLLEAGGRVYLEEGALWPETGGRYVTTHLVGSVRFLREQPALVEKWVAAHVDLTLWIREHPDEAKKILAAEIAAETSRPLAPAILEQAWSRLEFTYDPVETSLRRSAADAFRVGLLREKPDLGRIYALDALRKVLREKGLPGIP